MQNHNIDHIFRAYDIRGIYGKDLDESIMENIGLAFAYIINSDILLSYDVRMSSESLTSSFICGFIKSGLSVTNLGMLPLGVAGFHAWKQEKPLAYITASHLEPEWNGVKFFDKNGIGLFDDVIKKLKKTFDDIIDKKIQPHNTGQGNILKANGEQLVADYINYLLSKIKPIKKLKVIVDCSDGAASIVAPRLFREAGFDVIEFNCTSNGEFPNRNPPDPPNLDMKDLGEKVLTEKADIGVALDGDGDRMVVVDDSGRKTSPEQVAYFVVSELLKSVDGPVIENVECSMLLDSLVDLFGQKIIRVPVGHTYLMKAASDHKASFGFETSCHFAMPSLMPTDDALAVLYYTTCLLSGQDDKLSKIINQIPILPFARINFICADNKKFGIIDVLKKRFTQEYDTKQINDMDGIRIDFPNGWVLIRASNTEPKIRLTIEAENEKEFDIIKNKFTKILDDEIRT
ncbi:MAG: hypothetical protein ABIA21_00315 [Candidatus Aenigmatarchaeota archaeon]